MSISQVFLVSPRGDCVIFKDFRGDVPKVRGGMTGSFLSFRDFAVFIGKKRVMRGAAWRWSQCATW